MKRTLQYSEAMAKAARSGFRNEDWVVSQFTKHRNSRWSQGWLRVMGYDIHTMKNLCAQTTRKMGFFNKADVLVLVGDNVEWISVKKFSASFNQIDKRWIDDYAKMWHMPDDVVKVLKMYCGEDDFRPGQINDVKGLGMASDMRRFTMNEISPAGREAVLTFLNKNKSKIIKDVMSGTGKAAAKWMLLVEERNDLPYRSAILPINSVVRHCSGGAYITQNGVIRLGRLTIQRKGGDNGRKSAQMLQFKFSPKDMFDMPDTVILNSCDQNN